MISNLILGFVIGLVVTGVVLILRHPEKKRADRLEKIIDRMAEAEVDKNAEFFARGERLKRLEAIARKIVQNNQAILDLPHSIIDELETILKTTSDGEKEG